MARYHYQTRRDAERRFPCRVDIPVPGLGGRLNEMFAWCDENLAGEWTHAGVTDRSRRDSLGISVDFARFYFMDEAAAQKFRERWGPP